MQSRHTSNTNLTVVNNGLYQGLRVSPRALSCQYLDATQRVIQNALNEHPRTLMVRFDLHLPCWMNLPDSPMAYDTNVITKFIKSLNAKIANDKAYKQREGKRVHPCTLRYVWAKERATADTDHYHVAIFLNNDTYHRLGNFNVPGRNLSTKIVEAWASAIGLASHAARGLVHFPKDMPVYYIDRNAPNYPQTLGDSFYRLSYLAKLETKHYGDRTRSFGSSNV